MRASDVGVGVAGDPVAYAHPGCEVHGWCDKYVPEDESAADKYLVPCENCRGYEDEHHYTKEKNDKD